MEAKLAAKKLALGAKSGGTIANKVDNSSNVSSYESDFDRGILNPRSFLLIYIWILHFSNCVCIS